jgi:hypothetical protein
LNCFRYLEFKNLDEVDRISPYEYKLLMKGARLRNVDVDFKQHWQAFLNHLVRSEKKSGKNKTKPVYPTFKSFYDYEKEQKKALGADESNQRLNDIKKIMQGG